MAFKITGWFRHASSVDKVGAQWRRLSRLSRRVGRGLWFYRLTVRGLMWLYGMPWVQERFFRQQKELMESFLTQIGLGVENLPQVVQRHLLVRTHKRFSFNSLLSQLTAEELASLVTVEGWPILQQARSEGRGVLLLFSHMWGQKTFLYYLINLKLNEISIGYGRKKALREHGLEDSDTNHLVRFSRDLFAARKVLKKGGVASILPDGKHGQRTVEVPFFGRPYQFRTGFAELALLTNATVIPVVVTPQGDGRVHARFASQLEYESLPPAARQRALIEQYVAHLEQMWRDNPGAIDTGHIVRYMQAARGDPSKHYARLHG